VDGSAYVNHVELVRRARGAEMPASFWTDPLMYQGGSDSFLGPREPIAMGDEAWGIDFEAEVAVITGRRAHGCDAGGGRGGDPPRRARQRRVAAQPDSRGARKGFGFFQSKPSSALSPVAVTPDELGEAWDGGRLRLPLLSFVNGQPFGRPNAGVDMTFDFPTLIAHAARTRPLGAGTIVGSGTVSNKDADGGPGRPIAAGGLGYSCIAEMRTVETILGGGPETPFLRFGDTVRVEMKDGKGHSIFGAIEQEVVRTWILAVIFGRPPLSSRPGVRRHGEPRTPFR
jgi:fumarylacetoacetate (FAA) hydrolase